MGSHFKISMQRYIVRDPVGEYIIGDEEDKKEALERDKDDNIRAPFQEPEIPKVQTTLNTFFTTRLSKYKNRIIFAGSRHWTRKEPILNKLLKYDPTTTLIIHGGCRGADMIADELARLYEFDVLSVPAKWNKYGKRAGPLRNKEMIEKYKPTIVYLFTEDWQSSPGTNNMFMQARKAGIKVKIWQESFQPNKLLFDE
jgi:hypothetical protein